jgi:hypothetical protein
MLKQGVLKTSTHALARALLARREGPLRGITVGRFFISWDGKPGDYMETVDTAEFFGEAKTKDRFTVGASN